jgi:hypothetical protein
MTAGQFQLLTEPDLSNIWHDSFPEIEEQFSAIFNIRDMERLKITDAKMAGFGPLQVQAEGGSVIYDEAIAPVTRDYESVVRALGYKISDKLIRGELYGEVNLLERDLLRSSKDDMEQFAFGLLNNATGTGVSTGFDGLALASTAHTRLDGGATQANRPTTLAALSLAELHTAVITFRNWRNDRGRPFRSIPQSLVIPPDLELDAIELLESAMRPDTANNATNAITRFGLTPKVVDYLTTATYWSIVGDSHDINFLWWFRPETGSEVDFDTDTIKRKVRQSYARGHGEWRGYYQGNS